MGRSCKPERSGQREERPLFSGSKVPKSPAFPTYLDVTRSAAPWELAGSAPRAVGNAAIVMCDDRKDGIVPVSAFGRLAAGLTMLLVTSLMTVLALPSAPAGAATRAVLVPLTTPDQTPCQDVFFLGARGSGESGNEKWGLGDTVLPTLNWYRDGVSGRGTFAS